MHCPNCGIKVVSNQKYCRSCGFGLEKFSQLFTEQSLAAESTDSAPMQSEDLQERQRRVERWRNIVGTVLFMALIGIGAGYGAIYRMMIVQGKFVAGAMLLLFLVGLTAMVVLSVLADELKEATAHRKQKQSKATPENLPAAETTSKLELDAYHEPLESVTENTTRSLDPAPAVIEKRSGEHHAI